MSKSYIPAKEQDLASWALNMSGLITASPTTYALTSTIATALAGKVSAYTSALTAALAPSTRGVSTVTAKNTAKAALIAYVRPMVKTIQATANLTAQQKIDLGITVTGNAPAPRPIPDSAPGIHIISVYQKTVKIRLEDLVDPNNKGKPKDVFCAQIYAYVGANPPASLDDYVFMGSPTRVEFEVDFPESVPAFSKVWFIAVWANYRSEVGPYSNVVFTNLGSTVGSGLSQAA